MFHAALTPDKRWRIRLTLHGVTLDICGAASSAIAWRQCAILNRMRGYA